MLDYVRDAAEIYRQSFATIRAEADLNRFPDDVSRVVVRLIHTCGQVDLGEEDVEVPREPGREVGDVAADTGDDWTPTSYPVEFLSLGTAGTGVPVRATITAADSMRSSSR